ncbi:Sb-PDE family phosphodiesterase [bacterium]|nr:Sb-PDE family phosphodiesterase [bacterium]
MDVISITDHIEYLPHKDDMKIDFNRPYEIAYPQAVAAGMILIKGAEITRGEEPPGHHNAIFINDIAPLDTPDFRNAVKAAIDQEGFVFWNHPGWKQPGLKSIWYVTAEELYQNGWLHGIEVVNGRDYYPEAHQWCLDKKLTMMGNSDIHPPTTASYEFQKGQHRSMTLVFVKERTEPAIQDALINRRTVVYWNDTLIGEPQYLEPLFEASIQIKNPNVIMEGKSSQYIQITNTSDVPFILERRDILDSIDIPDRLTLYQNRTVMMRIRGKNEELSGEKIVSLPYTVTNLWSAPDQGLPVQLNLNITFNN